MGWDEISTRLVIARAPIRDLAADTGARKRHVALRVRVCRAPRPCVCLCVCVCVRGVCERERVCVWTCIQASGYRISITLGVPIYVHTHTRVQTSGYRISTGLGVAIRARAGLQRRVANTGPELRTF